MPGIYRSRALVWRLSILSGITKFVEIGKGRGETHSIQLSWPDATSSLTITFEETNHGFEKADKDDLDATAELWTPNAGVTITGPAAVAAGSEIVSLPDSGVKRCRLRLLAAADSLLTVWPHGKD